MATTTSNIKDARDAVASAAFFAVVGLGALLWVLAGNGDIIALTSGALFLELFLIRLAAGRWPVALLIPIVAFNSVAITGYYFWDDVAENAAVSASLPDDRGLQQGAWIYFIAAGLAFAVGVLLVCLVRHVAARDADSEGRLAITFNVRPVLVLAAGVAPLLALIIGKGTAILRSDTYLASNGPEILVSLGNSLSIASVFILGYGCFALRKEARTLAILAMAAWLTVLFATATRQMAIIPIALMLGSSLARRTQGMRQSRPSILVVAGVAYASTILVGTALTLRAGASDGYGLLPFSNAVVTTPTAFIAPDIAAVFGNFLFAAPLAGYVAELNPRLTPHQLATSLNPLFGSLTDWGTVSRELRINASTPYSAVGELANHGAVVFGLFFLIAGAVFCWVEITARRTPGLWGLIGGVGVVGLVSLFVLDSLQYNLRSTTRVVYYAIALLVVILAGPRRRVKVRESECAEVVEETSA